jgi:predicted SprT family Zn-dependent metalloprotease
MEIQKAKNKTTALLASNGLAGWQVVFDKSIRRFGCCMRYKKTVSLSRKLVELNNEEIVTDVILHEIAHALAPIGEHHGKEWKRLALAIGCNGLRCYGDEVTTPPKKYTLQCPNCSRLVYKNRLTGSACGRCCNSLNGGKYSDDYKLKII